jgi:hypothetical protein
MRNSGIASRECCRCMQYERACILRAYFMASTEEETENVQGSMLISASIVVNELHSICVELQSPWCEVFLKV